jgi:hypothetical protein
MEVPAHGLRVMRESLSPRASQKSIAKNRMVILLARLKTKIASSKAKPLQLLVQERMLMV